MPALQATGKHKTYIKISSDFQKKKGAFAKARLEEARQDLPTTHAAGSWPDPCCSARPHRPLLGPQQHMVVRRKNHKKITRSSTL